MKIYRIVKGCVMLSQECILGNTVHGGQVYHVTKEANIVWWWAPNWVYVILAFPVYAILELIKLRNKKTEE